MAITARSLTKVGRLGLSLAAGAQAADRAITWAHAIELADPTPYLSGGELVMTTGINVGSDPTSQRDYVLRLASAGSAALAVDTGTRFDEVPEGVLAAGDHAGLPVLAVPATTPFIAIARVVIDALQADELRAIQRVVDQQEVLARATLRGGIPGVVGALADSLSATVVVVGTDGAVLAAGGPDPERLAAKLADPGASRHSAGYVTPDGDAFVSVQKLRVAQPVRGQLAVRTGQAMSNTDRLLVAHAVSLISIAIEKPARVVDAEQLFRTTVTREIVCGSGVVDGAVLRYFGFDPGAEVIVVSVRGAGPLLTAEQRLDRLLTAGGYLMAPLGDELVIVLPAAAGGQRIVGIIPELAPTCTGGISRPVRIADIAIGLEQARVAAQTGESRAVREFAELGTFAVLFGGRSSAELGVLADPLDPLIADNEDLVGTLEAFLRRNGHLEAAASDLDVHRHTMRNRMQRIRHLLADDLDSADKRAQLWLALKARGLLAERER